MTSALPTPTPSNRFISHTERSLLGTEQRVEAEINQQGEITIKAFSKNIFQRFYNLFAKKPKETAHLVGRIVPLYSPSLVAVEEEALSTLFSSNRDLSSLTDQLMNILPKLNRLVAVANAVATRQMLATQAQPLNRPLPHPPTVEPPAQATSQTQTASTPSMAASTTPLAPAATRPARPPRSRPPVTAAPTITDPVRLAKSQRIRQHLEAMQMVLASGTDLFSPQKAIYQQIRQTLTTRWQTRLSEILSSNTPLSAADSDQIQIDREKALIQFLDRNSTVPISTCMKRAIDRLQETYAVLRPEGESLKDLSLGQLKEKIESLQRQDQSSWTPEKKRALNNLLKAYSIFNALSEAAAPILRSKEKMFTALGNKFSFPISENQPLNQIERASQDCQRMFSSCLRAHIKEIPVIDSNTLLDDFSAEVVEMDRQFANVHQISTFLTLNFPPLVQSRNALLSIMNQLQNIAPANPHTADQYFHAMRSTDSSSIRPNRPIPTLANDELRSRITENMERLIDGAYAVNGFRQSLGQHTLLRALTGGRESGDNRTLLSLKKNYLTVSKDQLIQQINEAERLIEKGFRQMRRAVPEQLAQYIDEIKRCAMHLSADRFSQMTPQEQERELSRSFRGLFGLTSPQSDEILNRVPRTFDEIQDYFNNIITLQSTLGRIENNLNKIDDLIGKLKEAKTKIQGTAAANRIVQIDRIIAKLEALKTAGLTPSTNESGIQEGFNEICETELNDVERKMKENIPPEILDQILPPMAQQRIMKVTGEWLTRLSGIIQNLDGIALPPENLPADLSQRLSEQITRLNTLATTRSLYPNIQIQLRNYSLELTEIQKRLSAGRETGRHASDTLELVKEFVDAAMSEEREALNKIESELNIYNQIGTLKELLWRCDNNPSAVPSETKENIITLINELRSLNKSVNNPEAQQSLKERLAQIATTIQSLNSSLPTTETPPPPTRTKTTDELRLEHRRSTLVSIATELQQMRANPALVPIEDFYERLNYMDQELNELIPGYMSFEKPGSQIEFNVQSFAALVQIAMYVYGKANYIRARAAAAYTPPPRPSPDDLEENTTPPPGLENVMYGSPPPVASMGRHTVTAGSEAESRPMPTVPKTPVSSSKPQPITATTLSSGSGIIQQDSPPAEHA